MRAIGFVLHAEGFQQCRFFVTDDKQVSNKPRTRGKRQNSSTAQKQSFAHEHRENRDIHWISHETVESFDHQMPRRKNRGRCSQALQRETREGFKQNSNAHCYEKAAYDSEKCESGERRVNVPPGDPPGHKSCNRSGGEQKKSRRSQKREHTPASILRLPRRSHSSPAEAALFSRKPSECVQQLGSTAGWPQQS